MELAQFEPFSLLRDIERMFEPQPSSWLPRMDVLDRQDRLVIRVEIPGVPADDIEITVEDRNLSIGGTRVFDDDPERGYHRREILTGRFSRTVVLPDGLDAGQITAEARDGMLEVSIPRRPEVLPRKVKVEVTSP